MIDLLQIFLSESFWAASLRIATPLIFGVLGALLCERSGVLNLGIEGIFVVGAMMGWLVAVYLTGSLWLGVVAAALSGGLFGLFHAILTVPLGLVSACLGPRHHHVRHRADVLRLSHDLPAGRDATTDRAFPRRSIFRSCPTSRSSARSSFSKRP